MVTPFATWIELRTIIKHGQAGAYHANAEAFQIEARRSGWPFEQGIPALVHAVIAIRAKL
jgi:hypothetical protein